MIITSLQNPKVKFVVGLRERRQRDKAGVFPVEGYEELSLAIESGAQPAEVYYCPELFHQPREAQLLDRLRDATQIEVDRKVFEKIAYRDNPDGWLATLPMPRRRLADLESGEVPLILVAEAVEKPGNLGAMLRTADAAGVNALISCDPHTDWGNPNVVRASKGALFSVPVADASSSETISWLKQRGIRIVAGISQDARNYTRADLSGAIAVAVGTEKHGLSAEWVDQADERVSIPMVGRVNSLNVATAAALLIYEAVRQRFEK